ncbi:hypothetical protein AN221_17590 [Streptomyces nanshensis]|uniref:Uncharacterized protein n=1 Tax=Streptomyces nanshensis TaxID=518642 RepID=A0A1E7LSZ9_9ACTN|nr:hypothetical protein AN221_17590 [Streptomyces nanshensis]
MTAEPGEDVDFRASEAVGRVGCQDQSGELHRGGHPARRDQRDGAQGPVGGTGADATTGCLGLHVRIEQMRFHVGTSREGTAQPPGMFQFGPELGTAVQPHAAQKTAGESDAASAVGAQGALQGQQPGGGGGEAGQRHPEVGEHFPHAQAIARAVRGTSAPGGCTARPGSCGGRQGVGYDGGVGGGGRAGGACVREAPHASAAVAGQRQENGAGAAAVARVPGAVAGPALAGPQVPGQHIAPGVAGQVRQGDGAG